jgi:putative transposase
LDEALLISKPEVFNSDQDSQFRAHELTRRLEQAGVSISMDGKGRALDNVFIKRLWRSVKSEDVSLKDYAEGLEAEASLSRYFEFSCEERLHQSLNYLSDAGDDRPRKRLKPAQRLDEK